MTTITIDRAVVEQALEAIEDLRGYRKDIDEAITALKAALAQEPHRDIRVALQAPGCERLREWVEIGPVQRAALETFVAALAQEQAESVAHLWQQNETGRIRVTTPDQGITADDGWRMVGPLYLVPPQRKPLTEEEILRVKGQFRGTMNAQFVEFARAIERALGIGEQDER